MKKLLIITYYWPPMGGGGVQRWLKHVKYIREFGWEPIIFTAENPEIGLHDPSLVKEIPEGIETIRQEIFEPYDFYKMLLGKKREDKVYSGFIQDKDPSFIQKLILFIRSNFFIPDARMFWIRPSAKKLSRFLSQNKVDAMVSTGPPHTTHLIALRLKKKFGLKWLADFRDPWTQIDYFHQLNLTNWAERKHKRLEKEVIKCADKCVTVSWSWGKDFEAISNTPFDIVTNGFDPADFENREKVERDEEFSLVHIGSLNKDRNPHSFWEALKQLLKEEPELQEKLLIKQIGPADGQVKKSAELAGVVKNFEINPGVPHDEALRIMMAAQVLLLPLNDTPNIGGVVPGKLYEYLGAHRPILAIGKPDADSGKIIKLTNSGIITDFGDVEGAKAALKRYFIAYREGSLEPQTQNIEQFSRKNGIKNILQLIEKI